MIDIEKFTDYVPTAAGSDLEALKPFLEEAKQWIQDSLTGADLYVLIAGLDETDGMKRQAQAAVCLKAYESAIPFLDLVQTPNGFAVVSNTNHVPASKERVERLLDFVARRLTSVLDRIILNTQQGTEYLEEWRKSQAFKFRSEIVFLTTTELRNHSGNKLAVYRDLEASHPLVLGFQAEIARHISTAFQEELLLKRGNYELSERENKVFRAIQTLVGLRMRGEPYYSILENTLNYMIAYPDEFPAYISSPEYRIKISPKYENKKNDSTFFFG